MASARTHGRILFQWHLVMEAPAGGSLLNWVMLRGVLAPSHAAKVLYQVLCGLAYMHVCGIVHGNVKPGSVRFVATSPP